MNAGPGNPWASPPCRQGTRPVHDLRSSVPGRRPIDLAGYLRHPDRQISAALRKPDPANAGHIWILTFHPWFCWPGSGSTTITPPEATPNRAGRDNQPRHDDRHAGYRPDYRHIPDCGRCRCPVRPTVLVSAPKELRAAAGDRATVFLLKMLPGQIRTNLQRQYRIFDNKHTWVMSIIYTMTRLFIGFSAAFPGNQGRFPATPTSPALTG